MTKTEEIMDLADRYSESVLGDYLNETHTAPSRSRAALKAAIEELAGNAALIADMKSKLNECHAALSFLLDRKPQFGAFDYGFGSASLGNLRAELGIYKVKETP